MKVILFYVEGLQSRLNYLPILSKYKDHFVELIEFPVIPKNNKTGQRSSKLLNKIMSSSLEYIIFNLCVFNLYSLFARISKNRIKDYAQEWAIKHTYKEYIDKDLQQQILDQKVDWIINGTGIILKDNIIKIPRFGVLNLHGAPLPEFRGAANYIWMLKNKLEYAYSTLHLVDSGIDTGPILCYGPKIRIVPKMTAFQLWFYIRSSAPDVFKSIENNWLKGHILPQKKQSGCIIPMRSFPKKSDISELKKEGHKVISINDIIQIVKLAINKHQINLLE